MPRKPKRIPTLAHGRPGIQKSTSVKLSKRAGRRIINAHHQLSKSLHDAERAGDEDAVLEIRQRLEAQGGLVSYQHASLLGQSQERGGDSSKVLVEWMKSRRAKDTSVFRVLEVGALSTKNACSLSPGFAVTRIDLNSQDAGISKQDFMERPQPGNDDDRFDIVSLSLVLNFVPSKEGRGNMLLHSRNFLRPTSTIDGGRAHGGFLFMVLPAACLNNSRYMDEKRFGEIMSSIGFILLEQKWTDKLVYQLWEFRHTPSGLPPPFKKVEIRSGKDRNNFCVVL